MTSKPENSLLYCKISLSVNSNWWFLFNALIGNWQKKVWPRFDCCYYGLVRWEGRGRRILAELGRPCLLVPTIRTGPNCFFCQCPIWDFTLLRVLLMRKFTLHSTQTAGKPFSQKPYCNRGVMPVFQLQSRSNCSCPWAQKRTRFSSGAGEEG